MSGLEGTPSLGAEAGGAAATGPRGLLLLARDSVFGPFILGKFISTVGVWVHNIVAAILTFQLTGSAFMVGLVSVAQFMPQMLFAPLSGAMADRGDRLRQLVIGRLVVTVGSGSLGLWIWQRGVEGLPGAWPIVIAASVVGIGFVVGGPAMNALIPSMVRTDELSSAIALSNAPNTIGRAAGPAVGALVAISAGPALAFAISAVSNLVFAFILVWLPLVSRANHKFGSDRSVRAGFRHLASDPPLILLLIGVAAIGIAADPVITLSPVLSHELGHGTDLVGAFATSFGSGTALGLLLLSPARRRLGLSRLATVGLSMMGLGMLALAVAPTAVTTAFAFGFAGMGMLFSLTSLSTQIQLRIPDSVRGRVMAMWGIAFVGSRPLAAAMDGAITDAVSVSAALVTVATVLLTAAWASGPRRLAAAESRSGATP